MSVSDRHRLFVALDFPEPIRVALAKLTADAPIRGAVWTPPDQYHLTLRFIGEVESELKDAIVARLGGIRVEPFILPVAGVGVFPPRGAPKVLWAGVGHGHPRLFQLRQKIDDALLQLGAGAEINDFHPHVTLARCGRASPNAVSEFARRHRDFETAGFRADGFALYSSVLTSTGAIHTPELAVSFI